MNMQEFSHQLAREDHPPRLSQLFRALRTLRGEDLERLRGGWHAGRGWGIWTGDGAELRQPAS